MLAGDLSPMRRAIAVVLTVFAIGCSSAGDDQLAISDPTVDPATATVTDTAGSVTTGPSEPAPTSTVLSRTSVATTSTIPGDGPLAKVGETTTIARGDQLPVGPPASMPVAGDCAGWAAEFVERGATVEEIEFFFGQGVIERESGCGRDMLNDSTGDSGICQIGPVHNRAGWFGGQEWGDSGWLGELHGLRARADTTSTEWVDACLTLYRVCGSGPWRAPYSCANRPLEDLPS